MSAIDWVVIFALLIGVAGIAYATGSRRGSRIVDAPPPKGSVTRAKSPGPSTAGAAPSTAPSVAASAKAVPKSHRATEPDKPKAVPAPATATDELVRLDYEEDAEIDPTKIGAGQAPVRAIYQPPIQRIVYDDEAELDEPTRSESLFLVSTMAQTDKGLRRKHNEDSVLVLESSSVFVVADGMGGYRGGELASQLAVTTIADAFQRREFEGSPHDSVPGQASELARALQMANAAILETAKKQPEFEGMGTTICAARFSTNKRRVYVAHVGDSRCYRLRGGVLTQVTADHTMADHGVKGPEAAHLSRAVGIWPTVPIDIVMAVPLPDDVYLLCSDGLTKMVPDDVIAAVLRDEEDLKRAVEQLVAAANARGGKDNISVVLVRVVPPEWRPRSTSVADSSATA
jgi:serine/threonine protein phosphatase PrpC